MFQGFNESALRYYEAIRKRNCKNTHKENEMLYLEGVKYPLEEMYFEMYDFFGRLDIDLLSSKRRCISSAYNDARFCRETPVKEYFYIRFRLHKASKKNTLGFFFDASLDGYKYGLNIYDPDAKGMERIRFYRTGWSERESLLYMRKGSMGFSIRGIFWNVFCQPLTVCRMCILC